MEVVVTVDGGATLIVQPPATAVVDIDAAAAPQTLAIAAAGPQGPPGPQGLPGPAGDGSNIGGYAVAITSPSNGDRLTYASGSWVNDNLLDGGNF